MSKESGHVELVAVYTWTLHWISNLFQSGLALFSTSILMISLYMSSLIPRPSEDSSPNEGEGAGKPGQDMHHGRVGGVLLQDWCMYVMEWV